MPDPTAAVCDVPGCEWSHTAFNKPEALVISVLHAVKRHPEEYQRDTGKNPEAVLHKYREYLYAYRKVI